MQKYRKGQSTEQEMKEKMKKRFPNNNKTHSQY